MKHISKYRTAAGVYESVSGPVTAPRMPLVVAGRTAAAAGNVRKRHQKLEQAQRGESLPQVTEAQTVAELPELP